MAKWKTDTDGNLLGEDGQPLLVNDEPVKLADIEGVKTQKDIDTTVEERLARQKKRIETLEAQANKTPELERMLDELKAEKSRLEAEMAEAKQAAKDEAAAQVQRVTTERDRLKQELEAERQARVRDQVSNAILAECKDAFNDPATDVVPHLLAAHKREPKKDENGKDVPGEYLDFFKLRVKNDKGEEKEELVPLAKALEIWGAAHPHHLRPSGASGSGGGQYGPQAARNPWRKETWNVTRQQQLMAEDPAKARSLMQQAGVPIPKSFA
jgi:hypothetical protein